MKVSVCVLVVIVLFSGKVFSQEKVSVEEAVAIALKKNFDVQLFRMGADSAGINYHYSFGAFLPTLNAFGTNSRSRVDSKNITFIDSIPARIVNGATQSNLNGSVQLSWTLFDGTRMFATRQRVSQLAELGVIRVQNQMMNSVAAVTNNYYNIARQKQQLKAINELMSVNEERVKLAEKKLQVGTGGRPELLQAKVDLNTQRAAAVLQQALIQQLKDQLNGLLGMELPLGYETNDTIPIDLGMTIESVLDDLEKNNQALAVARTNIEVAKTQLWETRASRSPVISFTSAYNYSKSEYFLQTKPTDQRYNRNKGLNYGLSVSLPILNAFNVTRLTDLAQIRLGRTRLVYEQQKALAIVAVRVAFTSYDNQKKILLIQEDNLKLARENVMIALETFKRGINTFLELRTAQQSLSDVYNQLITARYNAKIAEIELLRLKGALLTRPGE
jgi:outer membrane protein